MANKVTKPIQEERPTKEDPIGKRIDWIRRKRGMKQEELGKELGKTKKTIVEYETGKSKIPIDTIIRIAKILKVTTDYLLGVTDLESTNEKDKIIHKAFGFSDKAIAILLKLNKEYGGYLIDTINFLIEQENPFPLTGVYYDIPQKDKELEEYEEKWNKTHTPIISMIDCYLKARAKEEKIQITDISMKDIIGDNEELLNDILPKMILNSNELIDNVYLSKVKKQLRDSKIKYLRIKEKNNKK